MKMRFGITLCILVLGLGTSVSMAQVPSSVDPGQIQREIAPETQADPIAPSEPSPRLGKPVPLTPSGAENLKFVLESVTIENSTAYADEEILEAVSSRIGEEISVAELFTAAAEMTSRYRNDGFLLSSVILLSSPQVLGHS